MPNRTNRKRFVVWSVVVSFIGVCVVILLVYLQPLHRVKKPVPLRKPLSLLEQEDLAPYRVVSKHEIENKEFLRGMGITDNIQWTMEDTGAAFGSTVRRFILTINYWDQAAYAHKEHYLVQAYRKVRSAPVTFEINEAGIRKIEGVYLVFEPTLSNRLNTGLKFPVLYFFWLNGEYVGGIEKAREILRKNRRGTYSYGSKVELAYNQSSRPPSKEDVVAAAQKVLKVILPVLENRYWPDRQR